MRRNAAASCSMMLLLVMNHTVQAEVKVLAHYRLGEGAAVSFAAGPDVLKDVSGRGCDLKKFGAPFFFADAPIKRTGGALLFNGKTDWYKKESAIGGPVDNFVLEAWAKARTANHGGLHGVVSNGDGALGYTLAQQGDKWGAFVGCVGWVEIAPVVKDRWVHLALVADGSRCLLYVNGKKTGDFQRTPRFNPKFTIGDMGNGNEAFHGEIHEVRFCTFDNGRFDPDGDLLLDYEEIHRLEEQHRTERAAMIQNLTRGQWGVKVVNDFAVVPVDQDWLISPVKFPVELQIKPAQDLQTLEMVLTNGLVSRSFFVSSNLACVSFKNLRHNAEFLRAVKPEARVKIDGRWYEIGGLRGQPENSYLLKQWLGELSPDPAAFCFTGLTTFKPQARYPWQLKFHAVKTEWPARGLHLIMHFQPPKEIDADYKDLTIDIHYEMYENLPVIAKWLTVKNQNAHIITVEETQCEILAVCQDQIRRMHVESDFSCALVNASPEGSVLLHLQSMPKSYQAGKTTTLWCIDPEYNTWATHNPAEDLFLGYPHHNLLISRAPLGPAEELDPNEVFRSFTTFELLQDSDDVERKTLAHRRFYRKLAPQVTENFLTATITSHDKNQLMQFIDQMAQIGFERLSIDPWPGVDHTNLDPAYVAHWKEIADYAKSKNIIMGAYELVIASRSRGADVDCINPETSKPGSLFGQSVCIASKWEDFYFPRVLEFMEKTGFKTWNADGPYHGDPCGSTSHKYHHGLDDSVWQQWKVQVEFIQELQRRNFYIPLPDWYFLNGQCSTGMGYREASANLSPQQQLLLHRQYIYDGTWHKIPTMGGITVQLVGFYSNDARVGLEPLCENLDKYEYALVQVLGSGAQTHVRGNRLYDSPQTKDMVLNWVNWYKKYRDILTSDIIHCGRPTGRDLDCILHVNPELKTRALLLVFNPTDKTIKKDLVLPLYYTGLTDKAAIREREGKPGEFNLDREFKVRLPVEVKASSFTWFIIE